MNRKERIILNINWVVFIILLIVLYLLINYLSFRHYKSYDLTFNKEFELSDETKKFLKNLKDDIEVFVLMPLGDEAFERTEKVLNQFRSINKRIKIDFVDPDRERERFELIAKKYSVTSSNAVVFATKDRSKWVEKDQFVEYDFANYGYGKLKKFKGEGAFLNCMYDIVDPRRPVIYFTIGHGEKRDFEEGERGIHFFKDRLSKEGFEVKEIMTINLKEIPSDASLLVICGPQKTFINEELELIQRYFEKGGSLFIMLDPVFEEGRDIKFAFTGLEKFLIKYNVDVLNAIVVDPETSLFAGKAQTFYGAQYAFHPITSDLEKNKYPTLFVLARPLKINEEKQENISIEPLIFTSDSAWGEVDLKRLKEVKKDDEDYKGPLTLALTISLKDKGSKMVVVGDSDFISDGAYISQLGGNPILALNIVKYLLKMEDRIAIPPKDLDTKGVILTTTQLLTNFVLLVILLPFSIGVLGVIVYFVRRRR